MQIKHGLLKVHFMQLSHEVTRRRLEQLSDMARVPALAKLGAPRRTLPPVALGDGDESEHEVRCVRHIFEMGYVVLQFQVRNAVKGQNMTGVLVRVVSSDDDLFNVESEIELPFLPYNSTHVLRGPKRKEADHRISPDFLQLRSLL